MKKILLLILVQGLLFSCSPMTKESYLNQFENLIEEVSDENVTLNPEDWEKYDIEYSKLTGKWHEEFTQELDWSEELKITKWKVQYTMYRTKDNAINFFNDFSDKDINLLKEQVKFYAENGMTKDLEFLVKQANKSGNQYVKILENIFVDLDIDLNVKLKATNKN